jgi:hypothetical protein
MGRSRRVQRRLQILLSVLLLQDADQSLPPRRRRARARGSSESEGERIDAVLYGCGVEGFGGEEVGFREDFADGHGGPGDGDGG